MECPNCKASISPVSIIPNEQRMALSLETESDFWSAKTIGGIFTNMDKLLTAVAKDVGINVNVFVEKIEHRKNTVNITFFVARARKDKQP